MSQKFLNVVCLEQCKFDDGFVFVSDSQDVRPIKEYFGEIAEDFDAFFVKVGDGDYVEVWGIHGIIPDLNKTAYQIK